MNSCLHGSEGAGTQQCVPATRLIIGDDGVSAIGTLVERTTRFVILLHLPGRHTAEVVRTAIVNQIRGLPAHLRRSLTWDQGIEMSQHRKISIAADLPIYFCDPHSPWQRGTDENTNGLLRQYFRKGTRLSGHSAAHLAAVADELNTRPRKTLDWDTPAERLATLLPEPIKTSGVATTDWIRRGQPGVLQAAPASRWRRRPTPQRCICTIPKLTVVPAARHRALVDFDEWTP